MRIGGERRALGRVTSKSDGDDDRHRLPDYGMNAVAVPGLFDYHFQGFSGRRQQLIRSRLRLPFRHAHAQIIAIADMGDDATQRPSSRITCAPAGIVFGGSLRFEGTR